MPTPLLLPPPAGRFEQLRAEAETRRRGRRRGTLAAIASGMAVLGIAVPLAVLLPSGSSVPPRPPTAAARPLLRGDGIGSLRFGASRSTALAYLTRVIGPPESANAGSPGGCDVQSTAAWRLLDVYFDHQRFVGYGYGPPNLSSLHRLPLATSRGLRVGDTVAGARRLYGRRFRLSGAQGGTWSVRTTDGVLIGYLVPGDNRLSKPSNRIASIEAGALGCPGIAP